MKINWFSPLPPAKTDIGNYTARILPELSQRADITLWTEQESWSAELANYATIRQYEGADPDWQVLNRNDATFYQIGNNPNFHGNIWKISLRHAGIVVLHDLKLQHLFAGLFRDQWRDEVTYLARIRQFHGREGEKLARQFLGGQIGLDELANHCPLTGLAMANAQGMVLHSQHAVAQIGRQERRPFLQLPLPYAARRFGRRSPKQSTKEVYQLIVFGHLGDNRRLKQILTALASFPLKHHFHLDVYGEVALEGQIRAQIKELALTTLVSLHGYVSDEALDSALASADLALNLRYPSMGETSGSQLRIWSQALPALVSRTGWYNELPEQIVGFVRSPGAEELLDLHCHWYELLADPDRYRKMGQRGYEYLLAEHTIENYVEQLVCFARNVSGRVNLAGKMVQRIAEEMRHWDTNEEASEEDVSRALLAIV